MARRSQRTGKRAKMEEEDDVGERSVLDMFPLESKRLGKLSEGVRRDAFNNDDRFKVYKDVDVQGDCFYDCMCRAYNSQPDVTECITVERLRQLLAAKITNDKRNFEESYRDRIITSTEGHDPDKAESYRLMSVEEFRETMLHREYYATEVEFEVVIDILKMTPIPFTNLYGTKAVCKSAERKAALHSLIISYYAEHREPRYVFLYRKNEHFEIIVQDDRWLQSNAGEDATVDGKRVYNCVFDWDELPRALTENYAGMLV